MEFVDRFEEIAGLRKALGKGPALLRVYGRRRTGKTELLRKICREGKGLYLLIDEADAPQQRDSLSRQVGGELKTVALPYPTWDAFYEHLGALEVPFVVLDEFQRLLASEPLAVSRLQHHWDGGFRIHGPSLILCGSSIGMMQRVTAKRTAPLFGRLAADLRLRPFGYAATRLLYPDLDEEERVRRYAVFGGTPYYHQFSVGRGLEEAVKDAFLLPTAPLVEEPQNLLRLELQSPTRHNSILFEIGQGTHDLRGLESKTGVRSGGLGPYLETLRHELDLVRMEDPVCGKRKQARYVFTDPFFRFYYRFVFENRPRIELGRAGSVWKTIEGQLDAYVGHVFEGIAAEALVLLNGASWAGASVDFDAIGRWWNRRGDEIDLVAAGKEEVLAAEVSWSRNPSGLEALRGLEAKVRLIEGTRGRPIRLALVSRGGFRPEVEREAGAQGALLFGLGDLSRIFDERCGKPR